MTAKMGRKARLGVS